MTNSSDSRQIRDGEAIEITNELLRDISANQSPHKLYVIFDENGNVRVIRGKVRRTPGE
ncbi:MAG: hypothetical protein N2C14_27415 [Planctomycetales bacterium]